jgi:hypothetical protein
MIIETRRLVVNGENYDSIQQKLQLNRRTFFRYLKHAFSDDKKALERQNTEETLKSIAIMLERNNQVFQILKGIAEDPKVSGEDRIEACREMIHVSRGSVELYKDSPGVPLAFKKFMDDLKQKATTTNSLLQQRHAEGGRYTFPATEIFDPNDKSPYTDSNMIL